MQTANCTEPCPKGRRRLRYSIRIRHPQQEGALNCVEPGPLANVKFFHSLNGLRCMTARPRFGASSHFMRFGIARLFAAFAPACPSAWSPHYTIQAQQ